MPLYDLSMEESDILFNIVMEMNKKNLNPFYHFIRKNENINIEDENGNTLLHIASALGFQNVIEIIFQFRPNIEARNCFNWTPIMQASRLGHKDIVVKLIEFGADVKATNCFGLRPIDLAAASGNVELVEYLGIFENSLPRDIEPLHIASLFGHYKVVESLLVKEYDLSRIFPMKGITPLMCAAASNDITTVELFVVKAIRTSILDAITENVTHDQVLLIVRNGICGYRHCGGSSAHEVALCLDNKIVRNFLDMICQQLCSEDGFISCCIKSALQVDLGKSQLIHRNLEVAQVPLSLGITPLMLAAMFDFIDVVDWLISCKVDLNSADNVKGWTPFIYSVFHRNSEVALRLYECGANIHAKACDGISAFDFLPKLNDDRIVKIFYQESQVGSVRKPVQVDDVSLNGFEDGDIEVFGNLNLDDRTRTSFPMMSVRRKAPDRLRERRGSSAPFIMCSNPGMTSSATPLHHHNGNYFSKECAQDFGNWSGSSVRSSSYSCDKVEEREICCISPQVHIKNTDTRFPGAIFDPCFDYGNGRLSSVKKSHSETDTSIINLMNDNKRRMSVPISYESSRRSSGTGYISPGVFPVENSFPTTLESLAKNFNMYPESFTLERMGLYLSELGYRRLSEESLERIKKADKENDYTMIKKK